MPRPWFADWRNAWRRFRRLPVLQSDASLFVNDDGLLQLEVDLPDRASWQFRFTETAPETLEQIIGLWRSPAEAS